MRDMITMKSKPVKGWKQRKHVRRLKTKRGVKHVVVNPQIRKQYPGPKPYKQKIFPKQEKHEQVVIAQPMKGPTDDIAAAMAFKAIGWPGQEYPKLIKDRLIESRLLQLMRNAEDFREFATDDEAMGYISSASMPAPLDNDWVDIYQHLFLKWQKETNQPQLPDFPKQKQLTKEQEEMLKQLKRSIRKTQWRQFKRDQRPDTDQPKP
jgi:hypothetical protein